MLKDFSQQDLAGMTSKQAQQALAQAAVEHAAANGSDMVKAWAAVRTMMPNLYAKATMPAPPEGATNPNLSVTDLPAGGQSEQGKLTTKTALAAPPAGFQLYAPAMLLPGSTTADEFKVSWDANGGRSWPLNAKAIFDGLSGYIAAKMGLPLEKARVVAGQRFSGLAAAAAKGEAALPNDRKPVSKPVPPLTREAHLASARAALTGKHDSAAIAHRRAAEAAKASGETEMQAMHEKMSAFHAQQACQ